MIDVIAILAFFAFVAVQCLVVYKEFGIKGLVPFIIMVAVLLLITIAQ